MSVGLKKNSGLSLRALSYGSRLVQAQILVRSFYGLVFVLMASISLSCRQSTPPESLAASQADVWLEEAKRLSGTYSRVSWEKGEEKALQALEVFQYENHQEKIFEARRCLADLYLSLQKPRLALDALGSNEDNGDEQYQGKDLAMVRLRTGQAFGRLEQYEEAVVRLERAREFFERTGDKTLEIEALQHLVNFYWYAKETRLIPALLDRAKALSEALDDPKLPAATLFYQAVFQQRQGQSQEAMAIYQTILSEINRSGNRLIEAKIMNNLGILFNSVGEPTKGLANLERAATLFEEMGLSAQGACYMNMGKIYTNLGERGQAFFYLEKARTIYSGFELQQAQASVHYFLGKLYDDTGDGNQALGYLNQALAAFREAGSVNPRILTHLAIAQVLLKRSQSREALDHLYQALGLATRINSRSMMARIFDGLGESCLLLQDYPEAICHFEAALSLHRQLGLVTGEAMTLYNLSRAYLKMNRSVEAERYSYNARSLFQEIGQRQGEALALYTLAQIQRGEGAPALALETNDAALDILESLRAKITGRNLRAHFSASIHDLYDFKINLLNQLSETRQDPTFAVKAFETAERARAQSLLELLQDVTPGDDPRAISGFRKKKQDRLNDLNGKSLYRMTLIQRGQSLEQVERDIDRLMTEYRGLEAEIDQNNPRYAYLSDIHSAELSKIRDHVLDEDTVLLEYALGQETSYLFLASSVDFRVFPLPAAANLEDMAREAYKALKARGQKISFETMSERNHRIKEADAEWTRLSRALSDALIRPALPYIDQKRLLIIAEDALQILPFNALPDPDREEWTPLIVDHEVIIAPSASVLLFLVNEHKKKKSARHALAIFADPVFNAEDARFKDQAAAPTPSQILAMRQRGSGWQRLTHTSREAEKIREIAPAEHILIATGFEATREAAMNPGLIDYRMLHFATHGVIDAKRPELSGLVLSLFDKQGAPRNGFLSQGEIFQLKLNADLVVLSACQSALGQEIKGEGMVGMTQAFMYAGSPLVLASLWSIEDEATADFMGNFYKNMFQKNMAPTKALQSAQQTMWRDAHHHSPYYWGAFIAWGLWDQDR